ncbi:hypothetical protein ZWY2020_051974 [Hordeum vulgare]|nr:hypothetical protein ZWY2020_051974 [Hordeum vulgare]
MAGYLTVYCTQDYNVTLVYYLSHYLVDMVSEKAGHVLKLDKIDEGIESARRDACSSSTPGTGGHAPARISRCHRDCAGEFLVAKCDSATFRFHVNSVAAQDILLLEDPVCTRYLSSVFLSYTPLPPSSPSATLGCSSLDDLLRIPYDLSLQFEAIASLHLGSPITLSTDSGHGCRMRAWIFQFRVKLDCDMLNLILSRLFGGEYSRFNTTLDDDRCFSLTVTSPAIATLIASFGDFKRPGILLRFPNPSTPAIPSVVHRFPATATSEHRSFDPSKVQTALISLRFSAKAAC